MKEAAQTKHLSEEEIDTIVTAQAEDDTAWEEPITVRRATSVSISIPPDLATRAAFLAQLHKTVSMEEWLRDVIQQRVAFEEAAFTELKQALASPAE